MLAMITGCKKYNDNKAGDKKSPTELLTQKIWKITSAGFDDNNNGVLDPTENTIESCQQDNTYIFNPSGTGAVFDNAITCGNPVNSNFSWKFLNNEKEMELELQRLFILRLNENEMILNPDLPLTVKYMLVYGH
jgi:hypothetical protein